MKRLLLIFALWIPLAAGAQTLGLNAFGTCGYNKVERTYCNAGAVLSWQPSGSYVLKAGIMGSSSREFAAELSAEFFRPLGKGHLVSVEPLVFSNTHVKYSIEEVSAAVLAGWSWKGRVGVKAGLMFKFISQMGGNDVIAEPWNLAYSIEGWLFPADRPFNAGASLSTIEDFVAERFYCPSLALHCRWAIAQDLILTARLRQHNSGIFDVASNWFDTSFRIGVLKLW